MRWARDRIYRILFPEHEGEMNAVGGWGNPEGAKRVMEKADRKWRKVTGLPVLCNAEAWRGAAVKLARYTPAQTAEITLVDAESALCAWAHAKVAKRRQAPAVEDQGGANGARDKWIYEEAIKGTPWSGIAEKLEKQPKSWKRIDANGCRQAAIRYADKHKLPPFPKRKQGRPKKTAKK